MAEEDEITAMIVVEEEETKTKSRLVVVCFFGVAILLGAPMHGTSPHGATSCRIIPCLPPPPPF